ncbi:unnamed protein product, partial [Staurois parvus]
MRKSRSALTIRALIISATQQCHPTVPPISAQINATQQLRSSVSKQCRPAVPPVRAINQCCESVLSVSAAHQCYPSVPIIAAYQCSIISASS